MPVRRPAKIPEAMLQLQQQLDQWRGAQKGRAKLPESFWQAAVDLAKQYGIFHTAQPLRLDYTRLKQRLSGAVPRRKSSRPAFVELVRPQPAEIIKPARDELLRQAAQGEVLHNDDTGMRVLRPGARTERPAHR
jgi:hypothetical protein